MKQKSNITTVKIDKSLYDSFKIVGVKNRFFLQDLVNRSMYLYLNNDDFRKQLYEFNIPSLSKDAQSTSINITGSFSSEGGN
jgi:hypothetical protein